MVLPKTNKNIILSSRNIKKSKVLLAAQLNTYDVMNAKKIMIVESSIDEIEKNLNRKAIRELVPMHPADAQTTWSDTTKLQKLGYHPKVSIAEGVEKFVSWYKGYYKKHKIIGANYYSNIHVQ